MCSVPPISTTAKIVGREGSGGADLPWRRPMTSKWGSAEEVEGVGLARRGGGAAAAADFVGGVAGFVASSALAAVGIEAIRASLLALLSHSRLLIEASCLSSDERARKFESKHDDVDDPIIADAALLLLLLLLLVPATPPRATTHAGCCC